MKIIDTNITDFIESEKTDNNDMIAQSAERERERESNKYLEYIKDNFETTISNNEIIINVKKNKIIIKDNKWWCEGLQKERETSLNLKLEENWSVLILFLQLINKGYKLNEIYLEKSFQVGHKGSSYVDVCLINNGKIFAMIEVKKPSEYYTRTLNLDTFRI